MIIKKKYSNIKKLITDIKEISLENEESNLDAKGIKTEKSEEKIYVKAVAKRGQKKNPLLDTTKLLTQ